MVCLFVLFLSCGLSMSCLFVPVYVFFVVLLFLNVIVSLQYIIVEAPNERTGHFAAEVLQEFSKVGLLST